MLWALSPDILNSSDIIDKQLDQGPSASTTASAGTTSLISLRTTPVAWPFSTMMVSTSPLMTLALEAESRVCVKSRGCTCLMPNVPSL